VALLGWAASAGTLYVLVARLGLVAELSVVIAYEPDEKRDAFAKRYAKVELVPQRGADLTEKLIHVARAYDEPCIITGSDCATVSFAQPMSSTSSLLKITTPSSPSSPSSWGVVSGGFGACGDAGATEQAKGVVGTLALRASGSQCLADLHATLFAFAADGTVTSARLDVDGVVVTGLDGSMCK